MTLEEAKNVIYVNVIYACEKAGLSPSTIAIVKDACDTVIALADRKTEPQKECKKCKNYEKCKNNKWKCCVYQPIEDEPQTERSE